MVNGSQEGGGGPPREGDHLLEVKRPAEPHLDLSNWMASVWEQARGRVEGAILASLDFKIGKLNDALKRLQADIIDLNDITVTRATMAEMAEDDIGRLGAKFPGLAAELTGYFSQLFKYFDELAKFIQARRAFAGVHSRAKKPA